MKKLYQIETSLSACARGIEKALMENDREYQAESTRMGRLFRLYDKNLFVRLCAMSLLTFYKQKTLASVLEKRDSLIYYSVLGALMSVEKESEYREIIEKVSMENALNLDGFFTFDMRGIHSTWQGLARICRRLYGDCRSEEDEIGLLLYLLELQDGNGKKVCLSGDGLFVGGERKSIVEYYGNEESDLIVNVFYHRPEWIEVDAGCRMSANILSFLRKLSKKTQLSEKK